MSHDFYVKSMPSDPMLFALGFSPIIGSQLEGGDGQRIHLSQPHSSVEVDQKSGVIVLNETPCLVYRNKDGHCFGRAFLRGSCEQGKPSVLVMTPMFS